MSDVIGRQMVSTLIWLTSATRVSGRWWPTGARSVGYRPVSVCGVGRMSAWHTIISDPGGGEK